MASGNPLHQFEIQPLIPFEVEGINLSFTNSSLWLLITLVTLTFFLAGGMRKRALVPGKWQSLVEVFYEFVGTTVRDTVGNAGRAYFPFIFTLFVFILAANLLGMVPYSFTTTSHIAVTFFMAIVIFLGVTTIAFIKHGLKFFGFFLPHGTPMLLAPLMIFIEIFSYLIRPVTLSVRLAANMMAGHILLKVIAGFVISMGALGVLPVGFMVLLVGFEIFVAVLQAYIFTVLACVYLNDALHMH